MARSDLIPKSDLTFAAQLRTFQRHIPEFAALLSVTPAQVAGQAADSDHYNYVIQCQQSILATAKAWTAKRQSVRKGHELTVSDNTLATPSLPTPVPGVLPGVERRFRALLRQVKSNGNYNQGMGVQLGAEAVDHGAPDFTILSPKLKLSIRGDRVRVGWDWQGKRAYLDLCELQVDRGDGHGFGPLAHSIKPGFTDEMPFPATPARWLYRAIYRVGDATVGNWSGVVGISVSA